MDVGLDVVGLLVLLVNNGILSGGGAAGQAGIVVLSDTLVGLLGSSSTSALDGLRDVVGGVLWKEMLENVREAGDEGCVP